MVAFKIFTKYEGAWSDADELLLCLNTGTWRSERPVVDRDNCNYCGLCALFCPTQCMMNMKDHFLPNLQYCKGCGTCARECPKKVIRMVSEGEFQDEGKA
ncbi:MAG: 4Fe-4S binding protein [Desulfobacteraceae bacterium]|jgi:2-oxoacid:acceptor oxidoreductase delta subunit (pyruvate/2-ketoisovalerate family)